MKSEKQTQTNPIFTPLFRVLPAPLIRVLHTLKGYTLRGLVCRSGFRKAKMNVKTTAKKSGNTRCRLSHIFGLQFGLIVAKYSEICDHSFVNDNKVMHVLSSTCHLV